MSKIARYFRNRPFWLATAILIIVLALYWNVLAARRYVSEAHVVVDVVQTPGLPAITEIPSLIPSTTTAPRDLLLLRDYLMSADMLAKLDAKLDLRGHYSS